MGCIDPLLLRATSNTSIGKGSNSKLKVTPQPVTSEMVVSYQAAENSPANITLINQSGSLVLQNNTLVNKGTNTLRIQVGNVPAGTYILRLNTKGKTEVARVVIK
jgi:hypothetical protein